MQGNRGGRHPFFELGDPFPELGRPFGGFGSFGGFGGNRSLVSSFFGGSNLFDDPFFTRPFGGMFESSLFGPAGSPFMDMHPQTMIANRAQGPERSRGPIIEELNSDDEKEESDNDKKENPRKHARSSGGPDIEDANIEERRNKYLHQGNGFRSGPSQSRIRPQGHSFTFQSSTVSYGGVNGAYHTSSRTRRSGSDGVLFEEFKEADSSTMQANHRISRGLHNQGHSVVRNLGSDGRVNTFETLHNLNQDELPQFEQSWDGNARKHLPAWSEHFNSRNDNRSHGNNRIGSAMQGGGLALPSPQPQQQGLMPEPRVSSELLQGQQSGSTVADAGGKDGRAAARGRRRVQLQP